MMAWLKRFSVQRSQDSTREFTAQARAWWDWIRLFLLTGQRPARQNLSSTGADLPLSLDQDWLTGLLDTLKPAYKQTIWLALAVNSLALLSSIFTLQVYDRVVAHSGYSSLVALVVGMLLVLFIDYFLRQGRALLMQRLGGRIEVALVRAVFNRLMHLPALQLEARSLSYWQSTFRDIETVRTVCAGPVAMLLIDLPFLLLSLGLIAMIAWPLLPVTLLTLIGFTMLAWLSGKNAKSDSEREKAKALSRDSTLTELALSRVNLKVMGASQAATQRWEKQYALWMNESLERSQEADRFRDLTNELSTLNMVITTSFGALAILNQMMTMGALIAANILAGRMIGPLVQVVSYWRSLGQFWAAKKRLDELFVVQVEREVTDIQLPRPQGHLKLEGLSFTYPGTPHPQIAQITGQLGPHGLHAIVGPNGSGKSTLLKLLRGLYKPSQGRVLIDGADVSQFSQLDLSRMIGFLTQSVQLVSGSVRDNLVLSDETLSDERIIQAALRAGAHRFIIDLPEGYGTPVGEGGARFSGGQRKRLAIAQSLIHDPPILLLDEPTSDLDPETEQLFITTLKDLAKDHTVIVVTHSPALLMACAHIMVMDKGQIVAAGPSHTILPKLGLTAVKVPSVQEKRA